MTLEDFTEFTGDGEAVDDDAEAVDDDAGSIDGSADGGTAVESDGDTTADRDGDTTADRDGDGDRNSNSDPDTDEFAAYDVEPAGEDGGLGVVSVSQGLRVAEEEDETAVKAFVTTGNREAVRIGKYLVVPYPDGERLFCRITALEYAQEFQSDDATEIHARRQMRRDDFTERDYKFMAELEPMSVVYDDADGMSRRMTDRVPKPGAVVEEAADDAEIKTGLKIPEEGVFLGHLSVGGEKVRTAAKPPTVDYRIKDDYADGDPLAFRHTLVAGGPAPGRPTPRRTSSGSTSTRTGPTRWTTGERRAWRSSSSTRRTSTPRCTTTTPGWTTGSPESWTGRGSPTAATTTRSP